MAVTLVTAPANPLPAPDSLAPPPAAAGAASFSPTELPDAAVAAAAAAAAATFFFFGFFFFRFFNAEAIVAVGLVTSSVSVTLSIAVGESEVSDEQATS